MGSSIISCETQSIDNWHISKWRSDSCVINSRGISTKLSRKNPSDVFISGIILEVSSENSTEAPLEIAR